ncbi:unnamed protein product [Prunus brigantina]
MEGEKHSSSASSLSDEGSLPFVQSEQQHTAPLTAPIVSSYNHKIRPLLDAVDKLHNLNVTEENIQLPTIVVVGDQSSSKSSVLESLAGINLPRGQGICTRVPLIDKPIFYASFTYLFVNFLGREDHTDEEHMLEDIIKATNFIAGSGKGNSNTSLTLTVKNNGVPDLTMVDLPGITRVPVMASRKIFMIKLKT